MKVSTRLVCWTLAATIITLAGCSAGFDGFARGPTDTQRQAQLRYYPPGSAGPDHNISQSLPTGGSLASCIRYAQIHNPQLQAQFNRWKAALESGAIDGTLPDPQFTYTYFINRMGAGPDMEQRQGVALTQMFPWFGKLRLRNQRAMDEAAAEFQRFQAQRLRLAYEVTDAWYDYYYLAQSVENTRQVRQLTEHTEAVARARYRAATADHPDVIRAQIELGRLDDQLASQQDLHRPTMARLSTLLNLPPDYDLLWPKALEPSPETPVDVDEARLLALAERASPELAAMDHMTDAARRNIDLARKEYYPDIMLGVEWMDMTLMPGMRGMSSEDGWAVMMGVNIPIWRHKYAAGERQARLRHLSAQLDRANESNRLQADLKRALYDLRDARRRINLYGDTLLPRARDSVQVTEAGFRAGTSGFLDLIDSLRVLLEFELSYQQAVATQGKRLAEIEMLSGIPRKEFTIPPNAPPTEEQ